MALQRFNKPAAWGVMAIVLLSVNSPFADASTRVNFTGNLIGNPPCDITGDNDPIVVDFDEVGITKIDGINYMQNFSLKVTCGDDLGSHVRLYLGYTGMDARLFDNNAVLTNRDGLAIRLYYQGQVIAPDDANIPIVMSSGGSAVIPLSAVPVRDPTVDLLEGDFRATGTVEIRYP
ncbi:fimbrial protein [Providencia manganoxydans]|uniref:Fimbrial protein n=1 Tax=Providencia stuartii TaxID=588 RepID=A0AAI9DF11_PROST|nr:fimbrial protein [Providencia stuartii]